MTNLNWMNWRRHELQDDDTVYFFDHFPAMSEVAQRLLDDSGGVMTGEEMEEALRHVRIGVTRIAEHN